MDSQDPARTAPPEGDRHPHLGPAMEDSAMSEVAFTDHTLAVRSRDRSEATRWRAWADRVFGGQPLDPSKQITELHFFDVFGNPAKRGEPEKSFSEKTKDAYQYGQEKARQVHNAVAWMLARLGGEKGKSVREVDDFDWQSEQKARARAGQSGHGGAGFAPTGTGMTAPASPARSGTDVAVVAPLGLPAPALGLPGPAKALPAPAKALPAPPKGLPAPPKGLPAPPKGLPAPPKGLPKPRRRDDDQR